jgi:hypothetical protein
LIIELIALNLEGKVECILASFFNLLNERENFKLKLSKQQLKVGNDWYNLQGVYGLTSEETEYNNYLYL